VTPTAPPPPRSAAPAAARPAAPPSPAPATEAPRPDRWQMMHDAVASCGREALLARLICEQRVRTQYCNGYWGTVPQCPSGPANDRGQ
jgi:hypothetical protein